VLDLRPHLMHRRVCHCIILPEVQGTLRELSINIPDRVRNENTGRGREQLSFEHPAEDVLVILCNF
jgi:hypothetical protein